MLSNLFFSIRQNQEGSLTVEVPLAGRKSALSIPAPKWYGAIHTK